MENVYRYVLYRYDAVRSQMGETRGMMRYRNIPPSGIFCRKPQKSYRSTRFDTAHALEYRGMPSVLASLLFEMCMLSPIQNT
jgi:hypothetical protein